MAINAASGNSQVPLTQINRVDELQLSYKFFLKYYHKKEGEN